MLSKSHFYWAMTRKYIVGFSHIISDIHVIRENDAGETEKDILVPVTYAGKRKFAQVLQTIGRKQKMLANVLPRMSFLITQIVKDSSRKLNNTIAIDTDNGSFFYTPVPYNFNIDLAIWAKNMDDILQIVEQVCVFFNPHYTITVKEIPELNIERNISIVLNDVTFEIDTELDEETDRTLLANINFTLKGFFYPPISDSSVIDIINIKFVNEQGVALTNINEKWNVLTSEIDETISVQPDAEWDD